jgi:hypothetical protein
MCTYPPHPDKYGREESRESAQHRGQVFSPAPRRRLGTVLLEELRQRRLLGVVVLLHAQRRIRLVGAQRGAEHLDGARLQDPAYPAHSAHATAPSWRSSARRILSGSVYVPVHGRAGTCWRSLGTSAARNQAAHRCQACGRTQCSQRRTWSTASAGARARTGVRGCPAEGARYCHVTCRVTRTVTRTGEEGHSP